MGLKSERERADEIKIEKGIPMPAGRGGESTSKYPFAKMDVGDSFVVKGAKKVTMQVLAARAQKDKKRFRVREVPGGIRVWRIEDKADDEGAESK